MNTLSAFRHYFPEIAVTWEVNSFGNNKPNNFSAKEEQLINLQNNQFF